MRTRRHFLAALHVVMLALVLCSMAACGHRSDHAHGRLVRLYFGFSIPAEAGSASGATVSDAQFTDFVATIITPRFPDGLTILPAHGQWRGEDGHPVREESRIVEIAIPDAGQLPQNALHDIAQAYCAHFQQQSVLIVQQPATIAFVGPTSH